MKLLQEINVLALHKIKNLNFIIFLKILIFLHIDYENIFIVNKDIYNENKIFIVNNAIYDEKFHHK